ncbi:MAG: restriction endonuclease subunit S [Oscillospiraceae bacterium]|nr:restriction endonuclease subunit S [Oscillospiraceae bacterium]
MAKLIDITGKAISGEWGNDDDAGTGIPVLRTTNFTNDGVINYNNVVTRDIQKKDLSQKFLQPGDIIIEKSGGSDKQPVGRVVYYDGEPDKFLFNNFTGALRVRDKSVWYPRYVFYALYGNYAKGGTRRYENKTTGLHNLKTDQYVQDFAIQEQPLEYQQWVVSKLDKVTELIALRKEQLAKLDQLVKSRFIELFGDPDENPMKWETAELGQHLDVIGGFAFKSDGFTDAGIPVLRIGNINSGHFLPVNMVFWPDDPALARYKMYPGDLVMSLTGTVGKDDYGNVCILSDEYSEYYLNQRNAKLAINATLNKHYLSEMLKFSKIKKRLTGISRGVRQANISNRDILALCVPIPPIGLQEQFAAFVEQTDKSKLVIQQSLDKLELLKKSLMQENFG